MLALNIALHDCQRAFERAIFAPFGASGLRPDWGRAFRPLMLTAYAYCGIMVVFLLWAFVTGRF